ncbi:MAG: hypothetical protein F4X64_01740 [Chloroflexi bacterium]|nr:hypothetical protein [Chloroflexota bacterium]
MTLPKLTKATSVSMQHHQAISEQWVEDRIYEDPSLLGLGDLDVIDRQKSQPPGGKLDLLLRDPETLTRYVVELQLGATDPSHIIRVIEYWDVERRRYPQYEHVAVIVAEDVTGRFFNVINLFNGMIPLIAIQMNCVEVNGNHALIATRVLDRIRLGIEEEDGGEQADSASWEKGFPESMPVFHQLFTMIRETDESIEPNYRKVHITLRTQGKVSTAIGFRPQKRAVRAWFKTSHDQALTDRLDEAGLYLPSSNQEVYELRIRKGDPDDHHALLAELIGRALDTS